MVKASSRSVHHAFSKFLDLAHDGQQVVITKRGKPWARLLPIPVESGREVVWPAIQARAQEISGTSQVEAVKTILQVREDARW